MSVFFTHGSNILWVGVGSVVCPELKAGVTKNYMLPARAAAAIAGLMIESRVLHMLVSALLLNHHIHIHISN